jgi:hypothetical protein
MLVGIVVAQRAREQKAHEPLPEYEKVYSEVLWTNSLY